MRIATASSFNVGVNTLTNRQAELNKLQDQLATGKRVNKASDDPAAAARAERALAGEMRSITNQRSVDASRTAMLQSEAALGDAGTLLQQAREAVVASGNASYSDAERKVRAQELAALRAQLLTVANRGDGAGGYIFSGQSATQQPFTDTTAGVKFSGTTGAMTTDNSVNMPLTDNGAASWLSGRTGNGVFETRAGTMVSGAVIDNGHVEDPALLTGANYTLQFSVAGGVTSYAVLKDGQATDVTAAPYQAGKQITIDGMALAISGAPADGDSFEIVPATSTLSVFDTLDRAIADLGTPGRTGSQTAQTVAVGLRDIDSAMSAMEAARSAAGDMLNQIDNETDRISSQKLSQQTQRVDAEGLDLIEAYSTFQTKQSSYDAALKSYSMVQRMSLFDYLGG